MNLTTLLYQDSTLSDADMEWVVEVFGHPTMKKYLSLVGRNDLTELASLSLQNLSDSEVGRKHSLVQGKLSTIVTLLSITKPTKES